MRNTCGLIARSMATIAVALFALALPMLLFEDHAGVGTLAIAAALKRGELALVDSLNFSSGARQSVDVLVPDRFLQRLYVWLRGTLTISGVTVPGTVHLDGPTNLLTQLEFYIDGVPYKIGSGPSFYRLGRRWERTPGVNGGLFSAAAGVYNFEALVPLYFEAPGTISPNDTLIDGRGVTKATLYVTWGTTASLIVGNTSTLALSSVTAQIYLKHTEPFAVRNPFWVMREFETTKDNVVTNGQTRIEVPYSPGTVIRTLQLRSIDGSDLSDAIINTVNLRLNGRSATPLNEIEDDFLQAVAVQEHGVVDLEDGYYYYETAERGRVISTGLGAPGSRLKTVDLILDTTVGAGATSIVVHQVEHAPPELAAHKAAA